MVFFSKKVMGHRIAKTSRQISKHARARAKVRLVDLIRAGLLHAGDELVFTYRDTNFSGLVTKAGSIATARHAKHTRGGPASTDEVSVYDWPTNFAADCVSVVLQDDEKCKTNPSGFSRVRCKKTRRSLNELRSVYLSNLDSDSLPKVTGKRPRQSVAEDVTHISIPIVNSASVVASAFE